MTTFTDPLDQLNEHAVALEALIESIVPAGVHRQQAMVKLAELQMWIMVGQSLSDPEPTHQAWPDGLIFPG